MKKIVFVFLICTTTAIASWNDVTINGYFRETPLFWKPPSYYTINQSNSWQFDNLLHARQNLRWYPHQTLTLGVEIKTRWFWGQSASEIAQSTTTYTRSEPYFDWNRALVNEKNQVLSTGIDRAWLDWNKNTLQLTVGRQRIAWGTNLVWNPIDLFNPTSPLDFDNEEKPGTDAVRVQWYLGPASKIELAVVPYRNSDKTTAALLMKTNWLHYDFILLGGHRWQDVVAGGAWAGQIHGGGFRGEFLFALPDSDTFYYSPQFTAAISGDYTFTNSWYLHSEILYNSEGTTQSAGGLALLQSMQEGWLTPARMSLFGEIARDVSPLVRVDVSGILNPYDASWYLGPSLTWSIISNMDLNMLGLVFGGDTGTEFGDNGEILMSRLKWSF
jgi:hypothetical protein